MLPKYEKSIFAQLRCGILPLRVETGRFSRTPLEDRKCEMCDLDVIEDEQHFICTCPLYSQERQVLYHKINNLHPDFNNLDTDNKFIFLMSDNQKICAKYVWNCFQKRKKVLYNIN